MGTALRLVDAVELAVVQLEGEDVLVAATAEVDLDRDLTLLMLARNVDQRVLARPRAVVGTRHQELGLHGLLLDLDDLDLQVTGSRGSSALPGPFPGTHQRVLVGLLSRSAEREPQHHRENHGHETIAHSESPKVG